MSKKLKNGQKVWVEGTSPYCQHPDVDGDVHVVFDGADEHSFVPFEAVLTELPLPPLAKAVIDQLVECEKDLRAVEQQQHSGARRQRISDVLSALDAYCEDERLSPKLSILTKHGISEDAAKQILAELEEVRD